ncbi:hypothetical protein [Mesorhizobium sp. M0771]|uniref:hypothetical protein n=1 Tax=Mesorhizobium sp. M0771 TaxID=2956997 RepID=UPI00333D8C79
MNVIRISDVGRWTRLDTGNKLTFSPHKARTIRVELRASAPVYWTVERVSVDGEVLQDFLTVTPVGVSTLELGVGVGDVSLIPDLEAGGELLFSSPEYEKFELVAPNAGDSFLTIAHRRERNPQVEMMEFLMNQNMQTRMAQLDEEITRRLAALPTERQDDGNGVHEPTAPKREKLPKDPAGKAGKAAVPADGSGQQLLPADTGSGPDNEPASGSVE